MRFFWILVGVWTLGFGSLQGQSCENQTTIWSEPGPKPSFLALITGSYARPASGTWEAIGKSQTGINSEIVGSQATALLRAGKAQQALEVLEPMLTTSLSDTVQQDSALKMRRVNDLEVGALSALVTGNLDRSAEWIGRALDLDQGSMQCRLRTEHLLVRYLQAYGMEAPLFSHFNGGLYNYLQDSLRWDPKSPDTNGYLMALNVVASVLRLDKQHEALYLELLGDLLSKEPNRFNANYMAALAYMRAARCVGDETKQAIYDRKAIFALEAPRQAESRFNQYRFTQLQKALQADVDSAAAHQADLEAIEAKAIQSGTDPLAHFNGIHHNALISSTFDEADLGKLPPMLKQAKSQIEQWEGEAKRYAGDVDLKKEVKKDSRFNTFALFLIAIIVGAVIFFWRKLRMASK